MMTNQTPHQHISTWSDLFWVHGLTVLVVLLIFFGGGCGTGIGNPDALGSNSQTLPLGEAFDAPEFDFAGSPAEINCGSFDENSSDPELEAGRTCIRDAFAACQNARYLLDEETEDGYQFVSFVQVFGCQLLVHTVSDDPSRWIGDETAVCSVLDDEEEIELACGITD